MADHKEIDSVTGVETTGHVWDGDLKELNKPLPRWWLYVLYACIVWAIGYWILYPTWPGFSGSGSSFGGASHRGPPVAVATTTHALPARREVRHVGKGKNMKKEKKKPKQKK